MDRWMDRWICILFCSPHARKLTLDSPVHHAGERRLESEGEAEE